MPVPPYGFQVAWSDEDGAYIASIPEFAAVSGFGDTPEEAVAEARNALALTVETYREEGWELPQPAKCVTYSGQFRLRAGKRLHGLLARQALANGVSLNSHVVSLLSFNAGSAEVLGLLREALGLAAQKPEPPGLPRRAQPAHAGKH